jgi:hypothetical protein
MKIQNEAKQSGITALETYPKVDDWCRGYLKRDDWCYRVENFVDEEFCLVSKAQETRGESGRAEIFTFHNIV